MKRSAESLMKLTVRVAALEYVMVQLLATTTSSRAEPAAELEAWRARLHRELAQTTIHGFTPEMSDLLAQELTEAVDQLFATALARLQSTSGSGLQHDPRGA